MVKTPPLQLKKRAGIGVLKAAGLTFHFLLMKAPIIKKQLKLLYLFSEDASHLIP